MDVLILYGSQTGTAQEYAESIYLEATMKGIRANIKSLSDYAKSHTEHSERILVILVSNTGDGDPPDNAIAFWRLIDERKDQKDFFDGYRIALLGLGDSGYATFNNTGKFLEAMLPNMGAQWLFSPSCCDALIGNEVALEPWITLLWQSLDQKGGSTMDEKTVGDLSILSDEVLNLKLDDKKAVFMFWTLPHKSDIPADRLSLEGLSKAHPVTVRVQEVANPKSHVNETQVNSPCEEASRLNPIRATDVVMECLTSDEAVKEVTAVKFRVNDTRWTCEAGDSFGLCCENDPVIVDVLLNLLDLDGSMLIQIKSLIPIMADSLIEAIEGKVFPIKEILLKYTDIMHFPKKSFLRSLADHCTDENDRRNLLFLTSKAGSSDYMALANGHASLLDFLHTFASCKPSIECLFSHLPLLHPRFYSVCNVADDDHVEFVYSCMDYKLPNGCKRRGVCSSWLENCKERQRRGHDLRFYVFPRPSPHFRLPDNLTVPIIMICAGTGVSPFVGFLRTLSKRSTRMEVAWLIFGFRHQSHDFLFGDELKGFIETGILTRLTICASREPESGHPKYVQDALKAYSKELYDLLVSKPLARIYICGDELTVIKDINFGLQEMIMVYGRLDAKEARAEFDSWNANKRIIRDVWV